MAKNDYKKLYEEKKKEYISLQQMYLAYVKIIHNHFGLLYKSLNLATLPPATYLERSLKNFMKKYIPQEISR